MDAPPATPINWSMWSALGRLLPESYPLQTSDPTSYGPRETSDVGGNRGGELLLILEGKTRDFQSLSST